VTTRQRQQGVLPRWVRVAFWTFVSLEWTLVAGALAAPVVFWFMILRTPPDPPGLACRVTAPNIRSIRVGDTKASVRSLLGPPIAERAEEATQTLPAVSHYFYRRRGPLSLTLDEGRLYIHFDAAGRVVQVYAKSGDDGVYGFGLPRSLTPWEHTAELDDTFPPAPGISP